MRNIMAKTSKKIAFLKQTSSKRILFLTVLQVLHAHGILSKTLQGCIDATSVIVTWTRLIRTAEVLFAASLRKVMYLWIITMFWNAKFSMWICVCRYCRLLGYWIKSAMKRHWGIVCVASWTRLLPNSSTAMHAQSDKLQCNFNGEHRA